MKQQFVKIGGAFFIVVLAMNIILPFHATATPGTVTISGTVRYQPRNWNPQSSNWGLGKEIKIQLYELDLHGHNHLLSTVTTNGVGHFNFPATTNWWAEDNNQLNIYLKIITAYPINYTDTSVTDRLGGQYTFASGTTFLSHDGQWTKNFDLTNSWAGYQAIWIFEDLRNAWNEVHNNDIRNGQSYDPGDVRAVWENGYDCLAYPLPGYGTICNSFAYGGPLPFIFIANNNNNSSMDVVIHETAHMFMINANGWWYVSSGCFNHYIDKTTHDASCAWSEGWADFLPLFVNKDQCYNRTAVNPCSGQPDIDYFNLELGSTAKNGG